MMRERGGVLGSFVNKVLSIKPFSTFTSRGNKIGWDPGADVIACACYLTEEGVLHTNISHPNMNYDPFSTTSS